MTKNKSRAEQIQECATRWSGALESERAALEEQLVRLCEPMVIAIVRRFEHRGEPVDDLKQVAFGALVSGVRRYDPKTGVKFSSYAGKCVAGSIRNHFRDNTWALKVPRGEQDLAAAYWTLCERTANGDDLPIGEAAEELGVTPGVLARALTACSAWKASDLGSSGEQFAGSVPDFSDAVHSDFFAEDLLAPLSPVERSLVWGRIVDERPQADIARELGLTPMQASRAFKAALEKLRARASSLGVAATL